MKKIVSIVVSAALITCIGYFFYTFTLVKTPANNKSNAPGAESRNLSAVSNNSMQAKEPVSSAPQVSQPGVANSAGNDSPPQKSTDTQSNEIKQFDIKSFKYAQIKGSGVNVRAASHIAADNSIGKVAKGDIFEILGAEQPANDNHKWIKIKLKDGKAGFVREDLIELRALKNAK